MKSGKEEVLLKQSPFWAKSITWTLIGGTTFGVVWLSLAKTIEDMGATSLAIKDMAGLLRPLKAFDLIKNLKKNLNIPVYLHTHATTGLSDATNLKAYEAGVDNIDLSLIHI